MQKIVVAYVPVLHAGYWRFFEAHRGEALYIVGREFLQAFPHIGKDIRALDPELVQQLLKDTVLYPQVSVLTKATLKELNRQSTKIVMPNEEIMHSLAETYLPQHAVIYVDTFLRWDKVKTSQPVTVTPDTTISDRDFEAKLLELAETVAQASSDWWRRVGAVLTKNGRVLGMAANHHLPSAYQPYYDGDPRANFHKGQSIELTTAIHAEAKVIAQAAKEGSSTANCDLYVTTFPCPVCAKLIAAAGIKNLYYRDPYAMLDGESVLRQAGVTLIAVERSS